MMAFATPPPVLSGQAELVQRVITGIVLAVVGMSILWWGVYPFAALVGLFAIVGLGEFYDLAERKGLRPGKRLGALVSLAVILAATFAGELAAQHVLLGGLVLVFSILLLRPQERVSAFLDSALTALGILYVGWFFSFLIHLRKLPSGAELVTLLILATAFTDMGGYFIGRRYGRVRLAPRVSPKKTVEGSLGGAFTAMLACGIGGLGMGIAFQHSLVVALLVAVVGQMGDLFESSLKRDVGVKDSGKALRGHGGVLDRFDSLALAAPIFYLYAVYVML